MKVLALDFDLTLTKIHSNGYPDINETYFDSDDLNKIKLYFQKLKSINVNIYIITRGIRQLVYNYIKKYGLDIYITNIYGADDSAGVNLGGHTWSILKVRYLNQIITKETTHNVCMKSDIYFIDDTPENVNCAIQNGFCNSYICEPGCGVLYIKTIVDILTSDKSV